jgi:hypothetical protein
MRVLLLLAAAVATSALGVAHGFADTPDSKQATQAKPDNYAQVVLHVEGMI